MAGATTIPPMQMGATTFVWGARTYVMGILNCTPDSFASDGLSTGRGAAANVETALQIAAVFVRDGADILDVGGESTRPGAHAVTAEVELQRVVPVIERLARELPVPLSVDTTKGVVAEAALAVGATVVNDVSGLQADAGVAAAAANAGAVVIAMHNQRNWQRRDVIGDIRAGLALAMRTAEQAGVPVERVILDPGFGFGWRPEHNLEMLRRMGELRTLGRPLLIGTSRKSTIGRVLNLPVEERMEGTAATVALAVANGADIVRVHDVREMVRVARMSDAVVRGWSPPDADTGRNNA